MKELLKILSILIFISIITFSTINVFAEDSDNSNQINNTNSTNTENETNKTVTSNAVVQPMSFSASINITPQSPSILNLGTWPADGAEHTYIGATNVTVNASWILNGNLTVRAADDFTRGTDTSRTIALSNFKYDCPGYVNSKTSFTTTNSLIDDYSWNWNWYHTYTMNYYITIPVGTDPGTYNTTIYYTAT